MQQENGRNAAERQQGNNREEKEQGRILHHTIV